MGGVRAAMILCAGLGTRLRPLTDERAKPMVPIGDAPAVAHVAGRVRLVEPARIVVNVHHRPDDVRAWAESERVREGGGHVAVSHEPELLGTAGGVARARDLLGEGHVLVWNGDILSELDPRALADEHVMRDAEATLAVRRARAGEGNVGLRDDGTVVRLRGTRVEGRGEETSGGWFLGVHVVGASLRAGLPPKGCLVGDVYLPALARGARLVAHVTDAPFVDVGTLAEYAAANRAWLAARGVETWSSPTAHVEAEVAGSVVGDGARVLAPVTRSIVWPHARVLAPVTDSVVTTSGLVVPLPRA